VGPPLDEALVRGGPTPAFYGTATAQPIVGQHPCITVSTGDVTSPNKGWIIEAAGNAVKFVGEGTMTSALLQRALIHLEGGQALFGSVLRLMQHRGIEDGLAAAERLFAESPFNEQTAKDIRESDYAVLNAYSLVAIWGALETCIEDTIVSILVNWSGAPAILTNAPLHIAITTLATEDDARRIYHKVENKLRIAGNIVATYDAVLAHFALSAPVTPATADVLREANALRNCLLHRGGRVDQRAKREVPSLALHEGEVVRISSASYLRFHDAVSQWLVALLRSVTTSIYFPK